MLNEKQERIIELLKKLWGINPGQRFGQYLENYVFYQGKRGDETSVKLFYQPDDETLKILEKILEVYKKTYGDKIVE